MARVMLGVKGMNTKERTSKVEKMLMAVKGVISVKAQLDQQVAIEYDDDMLTAIDLIRPLRTAGLTAGMV